MNRILTLASLALAVGCADPAVDLVDADADTQARVRLKEAEVEPGVYFIDEDGDGKPDKVDLDEGDEKRILAESGDGSIHCDPTADRCPELPILPLGVQSVTTLTAADLAFADDQRQLDAFIATRDTRLLSFYLVGATSTVEEVYVIENNARFDRLLIGLADGTYYSTAAGDVPAGGFYIP